MKCYGLKIWMFMAVFEFRVPYSRRYPVILFKIHSLIAPGKFAPRNESVNRTLANSLPRTFGKIFTGTYAP